MSPRWTSQLTGSVVYEADARLVAATLPPGCASLAILDGPYGLRKAAWDTVPRGGTLADLYQGHLDDVGRVCAASASLYLWNTSAGWAELHPHILSRGWTFRALITWDKGVSSMAGKVDTAGLRTWFDVTEVCGFYQREPNEIDLWNQWGEAHPVRRYLEAARVAAGLSNAEIDAALGVSGMARHWFTWTQWCLPSAERYEQLRALLPGLERSLAELRAEHETLWADFRSQWEEVRAPFVAPLGVGNVWSTGQVAGPERLKDGNGDTMHPCQKPLLFAERMILASSRPGDLVWAPFGGTLRELVAAERMARLDPAEARRVVTCELNQDGKDYIGAPLEQIGAEVREKGGQVGLFGCAQGRGAELQVPPVSQASQLQLLQRAR